MKQVSVFIKFPSARGSSKNEHRNPITKWFYAPTKVRGCTKYEQDPVNTVGCRVVMMAGQADGQTDRWTDRQTDSAGSDKGWGQKFEAYYTGCPKIFYQFSHATAQPQYGAKEKIDTLLLISINQLHQLKKMLSNYQCYAQYWIYTILSNDFLFYRQVSNISRTLLGNWIVDHSDVVGASPVGAASTTSSFST